jgi:hypothetical protein
MSSMVCQSWCASFAPRSPTVSQILYDLKKKHFEAPIFVCLHCAKETHSQHAMAAHCRQHVRAGMGKGTVGHIKYYPDHTFIFLGNNTQPSPPQDPGSTAQQGMAEPSMPMNQVPAEGYDGILPNYTGCFSISDLARSLQLNGSHQNIIHTSNLRAKHATLQPPNYNQVGGLSSLFPYANLLSCSANGVGTSTTPASVPPEIDLTLRLGPPTPRPTTEVSTPGIYYPFQVSRYF